LRSCLMTMILSVISIGLLAEPGTFGSLEEHRGCTMILVAKDATADGSVLISYNNDSSGKGASHIVVVPRQKHKPGAMYILSNGAEIPQPPETYAYIGNAPHRTREPYFQNGVNEFQVAISFGTAVKVNKKAEEVDPLLKEEGSGTRGLLIPWSLVLERSKTAREGVDLMEKLFNTYGLREDGSFAISDPNEIWVFQIGGGHHWAAVRAPDNCYVIYDNTFRMGEVDCKDKANVRCSPRLIEFSKEKGLCDPKVDTFNFKKSWGRVYTRIPPTDHRIWRVQSLLSPSVSLPPDTPYFDFPLFLEPDKKITKEMLMSIMRDHLEGTELDTTNTYKNGNPHFMNEYTLCRTNTQYSVVTQLRGWLPSEIGGVLWLAMATPDTSVFVPWYMGITEVPSVYQSGQGQSNPESAYWAFKRISNLVNTHYGNLIEDVRKTWKAFEEAEFLTQESVEKTALELFQKDESLARSFLSSYSNAQALKAYHLAQEMINDLHTQLVDLLRKRVKK